MKGGGFETIFVYKIIKIKNAITGYDIDIIKQLKSMVLNHYS